MKDIIDKDPSSVISEMELRNGNSLPQQLTPDPSLQKLKVFEGAWNVAGKNAETAPQNSGASIKGMVSYEWFPGNFFLVCRWDRKYESSSHIGVGLIGYDKHANKIVSNNYDNLGYMRRYKISEVNGNWEFFGENERAIIKFNDAMNSFTEKWETLTDGDNWNPLCELTATKIEL